MANINHGILSTLNGTIGPVTGYTRNGKNILRVSSSRLSDKRTAAQLAQREKLKVCSLFARAFTGTGFLNKSFASYGHTNTGYNRAMSALMNRAVTGEHPHITLSYPDVLVSQGRLPGVTGATAAINGHYLQVYFTDNSGTGSASGSDQVLLVAYAPAIPMAVFILNGGLRKDGFAQMDIKALQGRELEIWMGFLSNDEQDSADSIYMGNMQA
jgi:hypothetical protein